MTRLPAGVKVLPGGLILHRFTKTDWWFLGGYLAVLLWPPFWSAITTLIYWLGYYEDLRPEGNWKAYYWLSAAFIGFNTNFAGFETRFRNLYFSLLWTGLTLGLSIGAQRGSCVIIPLGGLVYYHLTRLIFWRQHQVEFIPWEFVRNKGYERGYYPLEARRSRRAERGYSIGYHLLGWLVLLGCGILAYQLAL